MAAYRTLCGTVVIYDCLSYALRNSSLWLLIVRYAERQSIGMLDGFESMSLVVHCYDSDES